MTTIYIVVASSFDGDCSYDDMKKGFRRRSKAEEFVVKCNEEKQRIIKEINAHNEKYKDELHECATRVRDKLLERSKKKQMYDLNNDPDVIRQREIRDIERAIFKTHKYDPAFMDLDDEHEYIIQELELVP